MSTPLVPQSPIPKIPSASVATISLISLSFVAFLKDSSIVSGESIDKYTAFCGFTNSSL